METPERDRSISRMLLFATVSSFAAMAVNVFFIVSLRIVFPHVAADQLVEIARNASSTNEAMSGVTKALSTGDARLSLVYLVSSSLAFLCTLISLIRIKSLTAWTS